MASATARRSCAVNMCVCVCVCTCENYCKADEVILMSYHPYPTLPGQQPDTEQLFVGRVDFSLKVLWPDAGIGCPLLIGQKVQNRLTESGNGYRGIAVRRGRSASNNGTRFVLHGRVRART